MPSLEQIRALFQKVCTIALNENDREEREARVEIALQPFLARVEALEKVERKEARAAALEEAAQLAIDMREGAHGTLRGADRCAFTIAAAIRALKEKP